MQTTAKHRANRDPGRVYYAEFDQGRTATILVTEKIDRATSGDWWIVAFPSTIEDQEAIAVESALGAELWVRFQTTDGRLPVMRQAPLNGALRFPLAEGDEIPLAALREASAGLDLWGPGESLRAASPGRIAEDAAAEEDGGPERFALTPPLRRARQIAGPAPALRPAAGERPTAMFGERVIPTRIPVAREDALAAALTRFAEVLEERPGVPGSGLVTRKTPIQQYSTLQAQAWRRPIGAWDEVVSAARLCLPEVGRGATETEVMRAYTTRVSACRRELYGTFLMSACCDIAEVLEDGDAEAGLGRLAMMMRFIDQNVHAGGMETAFRMSMLPEPAHVVAEGASLPLQRKPDPKLRGRRVLSALVDPLAAAAVYAEC